MNDTEFTQFEELDRLTDIELEKIVIQGTNLHIHTSKASIAKRILENRRGHEQLKIVKEVETVTKHLENSGKEILTIARGLKEILQVLNFFKSHWFPKNSFVFKIAAFVFGTVILGIILNLIADWIAKFILHW